MTFRGLAYEKLLEVRSALLDLRLHLAMTQIRQMLSKYRPDQLRVPRGNPDGGQFADESTGGRIHVAGKYDLLRAGICDAQLELDEELCRMSKSRLCWSLATDRYVACMKNNFVPTLRH